jgi:hypothetical protein
VAECAQCKAPLESEFGFVVCPKCGYTNVLGVEFTPPEQLSPLSSQSPVSEGAATETEEPVPINSFGQDSQSEAVLSFGLEPASLPTESGECDFSLSEEHSLREEGILADAQEATQVPTMPESSGVTGDPHSGKESGAAFVAQVVEQSATQSESLFSEAAGAGSLIDPTTSLQFRLELYELDVRALESRVYAIVESLRLEEFWQAHPKKLGYFTLSPLNAHQLSWLLLRLEGVHDKWKVTTL